MNGWVATIARDMPNFFIYYGIYEYLCRYMRNGEIEGKNTQI